MSNERYLDVATITQSECRVDYDWGIGYHEILALFRKGEEVLNQIAKEKVPTRFKGWFSYRVYGCLVDNTFAGMGTHKLNIVGSPEGVEDVRSLLNEKIPRYFPCLPYEFWKQYVGRWGVKTYSVEPNLDIYLYSSAEDLQHHLSRELMCEVPRQLEFKT